MSDLPTPERMKPLAKTLRSAADRGSDGALVEEIIVTIEARASGRLADREAIDYEAAAAVIDKDRTWNGDIHAVVDAALGGAQ